MVVYGGTGVCRVRELSRPGFDREDREKLYYVLEPLYQTGVIYAPVDGKVFMRPVMTRQEADALIDRIPGLRPPAVHERSVQRLSEHYKAIVNSHDSGRLLALAMSIYEKKQALARQNRKFGQVDERYLRRAEELLHGELAVALGLTPEEVPAYIARRVEEQRT